ncbi:hypothetical protein JVU11DRAFT_7624 [Chiua virens]|nr:hypothetical protein JVU11DRAFT_7624 [Chiua virens]
MGPTGSGKSTVSLTPCSRARSLIFPQFVSSASGQGADGPGVGSGLKSYTGGIRAIRFRDQKSGQRVVLVDTPGFDDTYKSDVDILDMISEWLQSRLEELKSQYWKMMINQGAHVVHCEHVDETPKKLIQKILKREGNCKLLLQEEMVELKKAIKETSAGMELYSQLEALVGAQAATLEKLIQAWEQAKDSKLVSELERECADLRAKIDGKLREMQKLKLPWMKRFFSDPFKALRFLAVRIIPLQSNPRGFVLPQGPNSDPPSESNSQLSSEVGEPTQSQRPDVETPSKSNSSVSSPAEEIQFRISDVDLPPPSPSSESILPFSSAAEEPTQSPRFDVDSGLPPPNTASDPDSNLSSQMEDPTQPRNSDFPLVFFARGMII